MATTTETARPWQANVLDQLGQLDDGAKLTHGVVYIPPADADDEVDLLDRTEGEPAAMISAEDWATKVEGGEIRIIRLDDLVKWSQANAAGQPLPELDGLTIEPQRQNVETEEPAETVEEPAPDEDEKPEEEIEPQSLKAPDEPKPGEQAAAFDATDYDREDLQIPKVDGQSIDRISLKFAGEVFLDRSEPSDVAVYNALRLGKDVELLIEAKCSQTAAKGATDRDGDLDVIVGTKGLKVHTLRKPAGADWVEEA